ncbi:Uncharacterized protein APZ42_004377 [Daphnia magna]|uniref:Uncharacterized protein n=1 Tax=Daphnia magna TaxID=35525 RepID=A0A164H3K8_9CRUS|nr:Uncharacterized protein APZ42_004377 [Daphnia magna]
MGFELKEYGILVQRSIFELREISCGNLSLQHIKVTVQSCTYGIKYQWGGYRGGCQEGIASA